MSTENKAAKAALKEAKDFLTKKDFKSALRCCKKALNVDKNNYMALVFCGLCLLEMQQPDQALQVLVALKICLILFWSRSIQLVRNLDKFSGHLTNNICFKS